MWYVIKEDELYHHGIKGQKWGVRRFQNPDGTLTAAGKKRYGNNGGDILDIVSDATNGRVKIDRFNPKTYRYDGKTKIGKHTVSLDIDLNKDRSSTERMSKSQGKPYLKQINKVLDHVEKDDSGLKASIVDNIMRYSEDKDVERTLGMSKKSFVDALEPDEVQAYKTNGKTKVDVFYTGKGYIEDGYACVCIDAESGNVDRVEIDW